MLPPKNPENAETRLEALLAELARVDAPEGLVDDVMAHVQSSSREARLGPRQWAIAAAGFGVWVVAMQGVFSLMLGGVTPL